LRVIAQSGSEELATVYIAETDAGKMVEFVESVQPPVPLEEKWVLIISTLLGCPVGCPFCDAGNFYEGKLTAAEILSQIDYMVSKRFPGGRIGTRRLKIQFARMGEPALNHEVLRVLERLPSLYPPDILFPSLSTVAPAGRDIFFREIMRIKDELYGKRFQMQFSLHSTDPAARAWLVPFPTWDLGKIAEYGRAFHREGERKVTLNFALAEGVPLEGEELRRLFDPDRFLIKITPVNPTYQARTNRISSQIPPDAEDCDIGRRLRGLGYDVILSIGELEENHIGSNCGQHMTHYLEEAGLLEDSYTYPVIQERPGGEWGRGGPRGAV
jgi:23S rRNA (adenine2503-C2)-methyltransferase